MTSKLQRAVFAEQHILDQYNCQAVSQSYHLCQLEGSSSALIASTGDAKADVLVHPSGWRFHSFHRHILHDHERKSFNRRIKQQLAAEFASISAGVSEQELSSWIDDDSLMVEGFHLHVPPMLFGADLMLLGLPSGDALSISAMDAVYSWVSQVQSLHSYTEPVSCSLMS
jgi:hypothetical protein